MSKMLDQTKQDTATIELMGLPPLPAGATPQTKGTPKARPQPASVVERLQANADTAVRPALTVLSRERANPSLYDKSIATVRGLLSMYSVEDLDSLLLSCDKGEREVLLKSLLRG